MLNPSPVSKWDDQKTGPTRGNMMVDTGAAITLATTAWVEVHGLSIKEGKKIAVRGAAGHGVQVLGTTSFTV